MSEREEHASNVLRVISARVGTHDELVSDVVEIYSLCIARCEPHVSKLRKYRTLGQKRPITSRAVKRSFQHASVLSRELLTFFQIAESSSETASISADFVVVVGSSLFC